jgi:hypothetical protein
VSSTGSSGVLIGLPSAPTSTGTSSFGNSGTGVGSVIGAGEGSPQLHIGRYANSVINNYFPRDILYCAYKKSSGYNNNHQPCYGEHQADLIAILLLEKYIVTVPDSEKIKEILSSFIWETGNTIDHSHPPGSLRRNLILLDKYLHDILKKDPAYQGLHAVKNITCPVPPVTAPVALSANEKEQAIKRHLKKYIAYGMVEDGTDSPESALKQLRGLNDDEFKIFVVQYNADKPNYPALTDEEFKMLANKVNANGQQPPAASGGRRKFKTTKKQRRNRNKKRKSTRRRM